MSLDGRFLGHPWVFDHIRPLAVGGIDMAPAYRELGTLPSSVVLDIGCGTGDALTHIREFQRYLGLDTDPVAIGRASARHAGRANVHFEARRCTEPDLTEGGVTHVSMVGLLHHLDDAEATRLLEMLRRSGTLVRAVTLDIVYLPGRPFNNVLASLDRGQFCRTPAGYESLARASGLTLERSYPVRSHPTRGLVQYFIMSLVP
jgi:SAM-dependent methyltransferase